MTNHLDPWHFSSVACPRGHHTSAVTRWSEDRWICLDCFRHGDACIFAAAVPRPSGNPPPADSTAPSFRRTATVAEPPSAVPLDGRRRTSDDTVGAT